MDMNSAAIMYIIYFIYVMFYIHIYNIYFITQLSIYMDMNSATIIIIIRGSIYMHVYVCVLKF